MALPQATQLLSSFKEAYKKNDLTGAEALLAQLKVLPVILNWRREAAA
jgi:hypothetical protein